jgi:hypothetical protein
LEWFWLDWRSKVFSISKELKETQEDYIISKNVGKSKSRTNKNDRVLDDLVSLSHQHEITLSSVVTSPVKAVRQIKANNYSNS